MAVTMLAQATSWIVGKPETDPLYLTSAQIALCKPVC